MLYMFHCLQVGSLQDEIKSLRDEIQRQKQELKKRDNIISSLKTDIEGLKKEIQERDDTIQDKVQIYTKVTMTPICSYKCIHVHVLYWVRTYRYTCMYM